MDIRSYCTPIVQQGPAPIKLPMTGHQELMHWRGYPGWWHKSADKPKLRTPDPLRAVVARKDRLSRLPAELILLIFEEVAKMEKPGTPSTFSAGPLNRRLLPFVRQNVFRNFFIDGAEAFVEFRETCQRARGTQFPFELETMIVRLRYKSDDFEDPPRIDLFEVWREVIPKLTRLETLELEACPPLAQFVLYPFIAKSYLRALRTLILNDAFHPEPFLFQHFVHLRHYPRLTELHILNKHVANTRMRDKWVSEFRPCRFSGRDRKTGVMDTSSTITTLNLMGDLTGIPSRSSAAGMSLTKSNFLQYFPNLHSLRLLNNGADDSQWIRLRFPLYATLRELDLQSLGEADVRKLLTKILSKLKNLTTLTLRSQVLHESLIQDFDGKNSTLEVLRIRQEYLPQIRGTVWTDFLLSFNNRLRVFDTNWCEGAQVGPSDSEGFPDLLNWRLPDFTDRFSLEDAITFRDIAEQKGVKLSRCFHRGIKVQQAWEALRDLAVGEESDVSTELEADHYDSEFE